MPTMVDALRLIHPTENQRLAMLFQLTVTLLVFFTGSTRARIIAAHFATATYKGFCGRGLPFWGRRILKRGYLLVLQLHFLTLHRLATLPLHCLHLFTSNGFNTRHQANSFAFNCVQHLLEELKRFTFVLLFWIFLRIRA